MRTSKKEFVIFGISTAGLDILNTDARNYNTGIVTTTVLPLGRNAFQYCAQFKLPRDDAYTYDTHSSSMFKYADSHTDSNIDPFVSVLHKLISVRSYLATSYFQHIWILLLPRT